MSTSCAVCIEEFTKQPHKKRAKCPYCDVAACTTCTQKYLLSSTEDPHCMGCRKAWTREVMDSILLTTWLNGEYKKHRENVLLDREKSRLPAAQLVIERQKRVAEYMPQRIALTNEIRELQERIRTLTEQLGSVEVIMARLRAGQEPYTTRNAEGKEVAERRAFIMPCPADGCRGFLSQAYKCGVCDVFVCADCREVKGLDRDAAHTCKAENVESVRLIKKDTKPCPDCGVNIHRVSGCSQMFCTVCHISFDYNSGKKVTNGAIHNPHYYEYLRNMNGGVMPRAPGDIPCGAHLPNAWTFQRDVLGKYPGLAVTQTGGFLLGALRTITHIQHVEVPRYTNRAEDTDNTDANVRYLSKEIDEKRWKQLLQQREKRRMRRDDIRMRLEAFVGACIDIYGRVVNRAREIPHGNPPNTNTTKNVKDMSDLMKEACAQLQSLRTIFNEGMMGLSKMYKCQVIQLDEKALKIEMKRHEAGRGKKVESDDESEDKPAANVLVQTGGAR
jgi:hypothetical protein